MPRRGPKKIRWVKYSPEDLINGVALLDNDCELAYRRILDYIVITRDELPDNPAILRRITRMGRRWIAVREKLLEHRKITIVDGYIKNARMSNTLQDYYEYAAQQSDNAKARWKKPGTPDDDKPEF